MCVSRWVVGVRCQIETENFLFFTEPTSSPRLTKQLPYSRNSTKQTADTCEAITVHVLKAYGDAEIYVH
jgi:hypothetical protein